MTASVAGDDKLKGSSQGRDLEKIEFQQREHRQQRPRKRESKHG